MIPKRFGEHAVTNYDLAMEEATAEMNTAYAEWTEACQKFNRAKDSPNRLAQANAAHQKFLLAQQKCHSLYCRAMAELRAELEMLHS